VKLTKEEQINQRRNLVLQLHSKGMSQEKIAEVLKPDVLQISQKTVSRDIQWLKDNAVETVVQGQRKDLAFEWELVNTNLHMLRAKAWALMEHAEGNPKEGIHPNTALIKDLFSIIQSINADIMKHRSIGDIVTAATIKYSQSVVEVRGNQIQEIVEVTTNTTTAPALTEQQEQEQQND